MSVPEGTDRLYVTSTGGVELDQLAFTTSTSDIRALLDALEADERITRGVEASFGDTLAEIDAALAAGDTTTAISKLEFIVTQVPNRIRTDADAAALVIRAAEAVIADIQQRLVGAATREPRSASAAGRGSRMSADGRREPRPRTELRSPAGTSPRTGLHMAGGVRGVDGTARQGDVGTARGTWGRHPASGPSRPRCRPAWRHRQQLTMRSGIATDPGACSDDVRRTKTRSAMGDSGAIGDGRVRRHRRQALPRDRRRPQTARSGSHP